MSFWIIGTVTLKVEKVMKFRDFFKERIFYLVIYLGAVSLAFLVMIFTINISKVNVKASSIIYVYGVSIVFYLIFIGYEYYKSKGFYKKLSELLKSDDIIDDSVYVEKGKTLEQKLFVKVLNKIHREYKNELYKYEDMEKSFSVFTSQWVHQMKTPVSVINLLLQEECADEDKELFESIGEENERIAQGLNIMLYNSRINDFNHDFNVEAIDIILILRKVINDNKKLFIRKKIFPEILGDSVMIQTDKKWMYFVISQIVINAIKYTDIADRDRKFIKFIINSDGDKISLCIKDNGIGIPNEDKGRVFNEFFTGKNGRKSTESTGMGLYLAKYVCDYLGNELYVESEEGQGAEFYITFLKEKNIFKIKD